MNSPVLNCYSINSSLCPSARIYVRLFENTVIMSITLKIRNLGQTSFHTLINFLILKDSINYNIFYGLILLLPSAVGKVPAFYILRPCHTCL